MLGRIVMFQKSQKNIRSNIIMEKSISWKKVIYKVNKNFKFSFTLKKKVHYFFWYSVRPLRVKIWIH